MVYKYNSNSIGRIPKDLKYERAKLIYQYRTKQGMTLERIGKIFGITRERARQIIGSFEDRLKQGDLGLDKQKNKSIMEV